MNGKRQVARTCLAAAALAITGCSPLSALTGGPGQATNADVLRVLGEHMDGCDRCYQGGLGVGASFTFVIDCKARPPVVGAPVVETVTPPPE